jgi:hypothetical protein
MVDSDAVSPLPGLVTSSTFQGIADVHGTFVTGIAIVGSISGASVTPSAINGGLRNDARFKLNLDFVEFRGFFMVGIPKLDTSLDEFGFSYDGSSSDTFPPINPYDSLGSTFYDGAQSSALGTTVATQKAIYQAINDVKVGGVGWEMYVEEISCP